MAGVVKSMDSALKSMNLEKVLDCKDDLSGLRKSSLDQPQAYSQLFKVSCSKAGEWVWGKSTGNQYYSA